jgi:5-methylcytosine-specific restriction endonuclease McrA
MQNAVNQTVLVLDYSLQPLAFRSARRALTLIVKGRAVVQEDAGFEVCKGIMFPSVIRLKEYRYIPVQLQVVSRKNILLRDRNICQYCAVKLPASELTLDHILPRSRGGKDSWSNLVTCCAKCNRFKADRTPEEAGMKLLHKPRPASIHTSRFILKSLGEEDPAWRKYLYFDSVGDQRYQHAEN